MHSHKRHIRFSSYNHFKGVGLYVGPPCYGYALDGHFVYLAIGGFRNSQSDVIFAHAHIRGRQWFVQLYGICVKCGFIF